MPADASIYSMIRPSRPAQNPLDQYGQELQIRNLMDQQGLAGLKRQEIEDGMRRRGQIRDLFAQGGQVTGSQLRAIDPEYADTYEKGLLERRKTEAEIGKTEAEARFRQSETLLKNAAYLRDRLATVQDQAGYNAWIEEGARIYGPDVARTSPAQFTPAVKEALLSRADDLIVPLAKRLELAMTQRGQDISADTARRGQDITSATARRGQDISASTTRRGQDLEEGRAREAASRQAGRNPDVQRTLETYVAARNGLISGLSETETGILAGRIPAFTDAQQIGEGAVAAMAPVLKQIFRVAGEGTFTDKDQELLMKMVPTRTDNPTARATKLANIDRIISAKLGLEVPAPPATAPATPGTATGEAQRNMRAGGIRFLGFEPQ